MVIKFACEACGRKFAVNEEHAGRRSKCPTCGKDVEVPVYAGGNSPSPIVLENPTDVLGAGMSPGEDCEATRVASSSPSVLLVPAVPPPLPFSGTPATEPQQPSATSTASLKSRPTRLGGVSFRVGLGLLLIASSLIGLGLDGRLRASVGFVLRPSVQERQRDGSTANALEHMARRIPRLRRSLVRSPCCAG